MKKVEVLAFQGCGALPAVGAYELLCKVNHFNAELGKPEGAHALAVRLVAASEERTVTTADGVQIQCQASLPEVDRPDLVLVPAFDGSVLAQLELNRAVVPWLRAQHDGGAVLASMCTGAFALAEAGLLDGLPATTHWAALDLFGSRYPRVVLQPQEIVVDAGRVITCGGAFSFTNLIIYLVEKLLGRDVAAMASRICLIDVNKAPQGSYAVLNARRNHNDQVVRQIQKLIDDRLAEDLSVGGLAESIRLSRRQLLRRFKEATGMTPVEYLQCSRVEAAKRALAETREPLEDIAWTVGYSDAPGFRKLFVRLTGLTPSEYRKRNRVNWQSAPM